MLTFLAPFVVLIAIASVMGSWQGVFRAIQIARGKLTDYATMGFFPSMTTCTHAHTHPIYLLYTQQHQQSSPIPRHTRPKQRTLPRNKRKRTTCTIMVQLLQANPHSSIPWSESRWTLMAPSPDPRMTALSILLLLLSRSRCYSRESCPMLYVALILLYLYCSFLDSVRRVCNQ